MAFGKQFIQNLIFFFLNILDKLKIIKNIEAKKENWKKTCLKFNNNFKLLLKNKNVLIKSLFILILAFFIYYSIPITIMYSLNIHENITIFTNWCPNSNPLKTWITLKVSYRLRKTIDSKE